MRLHLALALIFAGSLGAGCIYEDHCSLAQNEPAPFDPVAGLRNPYNGICESYGRGGGGGGGGDDCGDYGGGQDEPNSDKAPIPDWGICDDYCETLGEADCLAESECRGAYVDLCLNSECDLTVQAPTFHECWAVTPTGPFVTGDCDTFDAEECARHNECAAIHEGPDGQSIQNFGYCADEPELGIDPGSCDEIVVCAEETPECPEGTFPGVRDGCYTGYCIPVANCDVAPACSDEGETQCVERAACEPVYEGIDCTCNGDDCTCADWLFESCS